MGFLFSAALGTPTGTPPFGHVLSALQRTVAHCKALSTHTHKPQSETHVATTLQNL
jgi:hypothetical protein